MARKQVRYWRGLELPDEYVDGRVYYLYDDPSMTNFTIYMDRDGSRSKISTTNNVFKVFKLPVDGWTGVTNDGGREWIVQKIKVNGHRTNIICALACGPTLEQFPTQEQEMVVSRMRAYLDTDTMEAVFCIPSIPNIDVYVALEGVV